MSDLTDRRVRKTKEAIRQGLITLMKKKKLSEITVTELTELVDINRATFYHHYKDIYDLFESIENDLYDEFERTLNKYNLNEQIRGNKAFPARQAPLPLFLEVFQFLASHSELTMLLLSDKGDSEFIEKLKESGKQKYLQEWKPVCREGSQELLDAVYIYIVSGCIGLIRHWLAGGMKESPSAMATLAEKMILFSLKMLEDTVRA
ncbi:MAG: TetR/AcrR family transcriptional regulator [Firmicutes bacterium]|nr:TetR/AcrR family transcriptional regulator [Bacillota bacterium]